MTPDIHQALDLQEDDNLLEAGAAAPPNRPPYDKVLATRPVRRLPYAWVARSRPGATLVAVLGTWSEGAGLARLTVLPDGTAEGGIIARADALPGDAARYARSQPYWITFAGPGRPARITPTLLSDPAAALLVQLAFPDAEYYVTVGEDLESIHCLAAPGSLAEVRDDTYGWTAHQSGRRALWDEAEPLLAAWQEAGRPGPTAVRLRIAPHTWTAWVPGHPALRWEHRCPDAPPGEV
ncbi:hypothetical protein ACFYUY_04155 [Kitasatospora sp. NPDC004745]|uniref:hypothetical protein n=1 Tax=Kitasatospora sp. NPDC004745 TaxID=3364019 RepID=UPI0036A9B695